jgi:hypothetical protein
VRDAAARAVRGLEIASATRKTGSIYDRRGDHYCITGRLGDEVYHLKILADGEILEAGMPPDQLPEAVRDGAARAIPGIEITEAERKIRPYRENRSERVSFELRGRARDEEYGLKVLVTGQVIEIDMPPPRLPQIIRDVAANEVEGIEITSARRRIRLHQTVFQTSFELEGRAGGRSYHLVISDNPRNLWVTMPPERLPEVVTEAAGAVCEIELTRARRVTTGGDTFFELEGHVGDDGYWVWVSPAGEVETIEPMLPGHGRPDEELDVIVEEPTVAPAVEPGEF